MGCDSSTGKTPSVFGRLFRGLIGRGRDACDRQTGMESTSGGGNGLFIVVTSDVMGKDADIGRVLMKGFFETMRSMGELPDVIFFMNAAVRLTTTDEEFVPLLKAIQDIGVEVYSCGTCLKHYGLEDRLRVGYRGSTGQVIEGIQSMKVVWI